MAIMDGLNTNSNLTALTADAKIGGEFAGEILATPDSASKDDSIKYGSLVSFIKHKYQRARSKRMWDDERQLNAYNNFRGLYSPEVQWRDDEQSRAFIKITKTKVLAAYAQVLEVIFAANKFPIGIEASPVPEGIAEAVHFDPKAPEQPNSTVARPDILSMLGPLRDKLEPIKDKLEDGPGVTPTAATYEPAMEAAKNMEKLIHDQLHEANASKHIRSTIFEMCLFGTGILKGPFALDKEYPKWEEDGNYAPIKKTIADVSFVSIWDAYPDPDARNMDECEYFIHRQRLSKTGLRDLKKRPFFRHDQIDEAVLAGTNYTKEYWENNLEDYEAHDHIDRYEVFEYWGIVDRDIAEEAEIVLPPKFKDSDQLQVNVWMCNDKILRLVLNPFTPARIPFLACPYEMNPYSFFGIGVAENMDDTQLLMNGFMRLAVDNAAKSSNVILEIDDNMLVPGQSLELYPGKVFRRNGGQPGQAVHSIQIPNVSNECLQMFDKARQLADEATGMPSYAHGMTGVSGVGRTASGMSMLMGAAKENIKAVVRNLDDYIFVPLGKSMFAFNMQFNFDKQYVGDLEVVARGTESLLRGEVRSQKILQMLQISGTPADQPYVNRSYLWRELAKDLDIDPDKAVYDQREAQLQALQIQMMNKAMGIEPQQPAGPAGGPGGAPAGVPQTGDPTQQGGQVQPGAAPPPGAQGFSASPQQPQPGATGK